MFLNESAILLTGNIDMNHIFKTAIAVAAAALIGLPLVSAASVLEWRIVKSQNFSQTSATTTVANGASADALLITDDPADFSSIVFSGNTTGPLSMTQDADEWEAPFNFASKAAMDAELPNNTTYSFSTSGGTLGAITETVQVTGDAYPTVVPILDAGTFNSLTTFDVAQDFVFSWNTPSANVTAVNLQIVDLADNDLFDYLAFAPGAGQGSLIPTQVTMAGGTLQAGTAYGVFLEFAVGIADLGDTNGFQTGIGTYGFNYATDSAFTTAAAPAPAPATWLLFAPALMLCARRKTTSAA
jgi:hypothetical protein